MRLYCRRGNMATNGLANLSANDARRTAESTLEGIAALVPVGLAPELVHLGVTKNRPCGRFRRVVIAFSIVFNGEYLLTRVLFVQESQKGRYDPLHQPMKHKSASGSHKVARIVRGSLSVILRGCHTMIQGFICRSGVRRSFPSPKAKPLRSRHSTYTTNLFSRSRDPRRG